MFHYVAFTLLLGIRIEDSIADESTLQEFNHLRMPAHGSVYKGMLYGFFDDDWARGISTINKSNVRALNGIPLGRTNKKNWKEYLPSEGGHNFRHHVGYDAIWFSDGRSFLNKWEFAKIEDLAERRLRPNDATGRDFVLSGIFLLKLLEISDAQVAFDSVPISKNSCKTFALSKQQKKFEVWDTQEVEWEWKGMIRLWKSKSPVLNLESFDAPFIEDFYALIRNSDYYFVTESGKLYYAPAPAAGKSSRIVRELWNETKRPITAVIEDIDHDKVWLFAKDKTTGVKNDIYFEMKEIIRTESFDPTKLTPSNAEGRAKLLLEYLPLISAGAKK